LSRNVDNKQPGSAPSNINADINGKAKASLVFGILSLFCSVLTGLPAILLSIFALLSSNKSFNKKLAERFAIAVIVSACIGMTVNAIVLLEVLKEKRNQAAPLLSQNHLKQMALAMHMYHDAYGNLPPPESGNRFQPLTPGQKPLLSWRVAILPFIEESYLFSQFNLEEPWDSPNNIKLLPLMPKIYRLPTDDKTPPDHTHYQVFVGNGALFATNHLIKLEDIHEAKPILIVEAAQAVPWTKPDDIPFDPNEPIAPLLSKFFRGANAALADGSIRFFPLDTPESTLKTAINRNGN